MDICLINPPLDKQTTSKFPMSGAPVGIACLAAFLRENGIEVSAIDAPIMGYDHVRTAKEVEQIDPLIVGVSCLTENRYSAIKTLKEIRERLPDKILVLGGIHPSFTDKLMLENYTFIDFIIRGEGEYTLLDLVKKVKGKKNTNKIDGISFIKNGEFIKNPNRDFIKDLDRLPFPAYDLFPMEKYPNPPDLKGDDIRSCPVSTSRGCPMGCTFCATTEYWGKKVRIMSAERIFTEVKWLNENFGINYIRFVDDTFTIKKKRVIDFCKLVLNEKLDIKFRLQARIDTVDNEVLDWLRRAGCDLIEYGAESGSERVLELMNKRIKPDQIKLATQKTQNAGIEVKYFLIVGSPGEKEEDTFKTFKMIKENRPDWIGINPMTIYPGTYIYELAKQKKIVDENVWLNYVNPKIGNAPLFTEYYDKKEMIFLSQLGKVWSMKYSPHSREHRLIEQIVGKPLNESLLRTILFNKLLRKTLSQTASLFWPIMP